MHVMVGSIAKEDMQGKQIGPLDRHRVERVATKHDSWTTTTRGLHDVARRSAVALPPPVSGGCSLPGVGGEGRGVRVWEDGLAWLRTRLPLAPGTRELCWSCR